MRLAISSTLALALTACAFGFKGGGLPPNMRTVAVLPFENETSDPTLGQAVNVAVKQAVESRLGLRAAPEAKADAVVKGTIKRYDPDQPAAFSGTPTQPGSVQRVEVTRRQVQLVVDVQIVDQRSGRTVYNGTGLSVTGDYDPGRENDGRRKALDKLVTQILLGAEANW